jgi:acetylornithine deacetylase
VKFLDDGQKPSDIIAFTFPSLGYGPIAIDHDVPGFESITVNYGTDIPNLKPTVKGQKRYLYGPGSILVAHSDHEALTEEELEGAVSGYEKLILHAAKRGGDLAQPAFKEML